MMRHYHLEPAAFALTSRPCGVRKLSALFVFTAMKQGFPLWFLRLKFCTTASDAPGKYLADRVDYGRFAGGFDNTLCFFFFTGFRFLCFFPCFLLCHLAFPFNCNIWLFEYVYAASFFSQSSLEPSTPGYMPQSHNRQDYRTNDYRGRGE